jgi:phosphatidylinositol alpha-1,6-mannosyltransferase
MTLFGLPSRRPASATRRATRGVIALGTVITLAAAFWIVMRPRAYDALLATAVAVASPVVGLNLAVITTDPPVLALILLALALAARPRRPPGGPRGSPGSPAPASRSARPATKSTAWLAVPVLAAMVGPRRRAVPGVSWRRSRSPPGSHRRPRGKPHLARGRRLVQNSVLFRSAYPLQAPAESLLPGHLLTALGPAGRGWSTCCWRPGSASRSHLLSGRPATPAAAWRLAVGLTLMFLLGPQVRFGYFIYPLGLVGWLALTGQPRTSSRTASSRRVIDRSTGSRASRTSRSASGASRR